MDNMEPTGLGPVPVPSPTMAPMPAPPTPPVEYAGFWRRVAAVIIDQLILGTVTSILAAVFSIGMTDPESTEAFSPAFGLMGVVIAWLYYALMESSHLQATVGKMALGIRVTDLENRRISFLRATGREFAKFISAIILGIGYLMAAFTARKQALHDMIAGTLVVKK